MFRSPARVNRPEGNPNKMSASLLDTRVPAVLVRTDRNPFHHGTLGAVRSLGRAGVDVHLIADVGGSPVRRSRFVRQLHPPPPPGAAPADIARALLRVAAQIERPRRTDPARRRERRRRGRAPGPNWRPPICCRSSPPELAERVADKAELAGHVRDRGHPAPADTDPRQRRPRQPPRPGGWACRWWRNGAGPGCSRPAADCAARACVRSARQAQRAVSCVPRRRAADCCSRSSCRRDRTCDWFFHGYADRTGTAARRRPRPQTPLLAARRRTHRGGPLDTERAGAGARRTPHRRTRLPGHLRPRLPPLTPPLARYHLLDFNPRPGAQFRLFSDTAGLDVVRAQHLDLTHRPMPEAAPRPGPGVRRRELRAAQRAAPGAGRRRELAWLAPDDRAPALGDVAPVARHATRRLPTGLRRLRERTERTEQTDLQELHELHERDERSRNACTRGTAGDDVPSRPRSTAP